jgi:hypothetical protein
MTATKDRRQDGDERSSVKEEGRKRKRPPVDAEVRDSAGPHLKLRAGVDSVCQTWGTHVTI